MLKTFNRIAPIREYKRGKQIVKRFNVFRITHSTIDDAMAIVNTFTDMLNNR